MKLWDKGNITQRSVEDFTVGRDREFDLVLASHDVVGSIAHAQMLSEVGILTTAEAASLIDELRVIYRSIEDGAFTIDAHSEDVHSHIEQLLTERLGEVGKKIHSGRSRNDQVLLDIKLFLRAQCIELLESAQQLFDTLLALAEQHRDAKLPGYTHFQIAMPSSFGLWFSAYAESLVDDLFLVIAAFRVVNKNPLGSAAGYGSSFALNRSRTTELLGFDDMNVSSVYAQMTRGKSERVSAMALSGVASTLSKLAYDVCLYSSQNFGFVTLPADYTTGSSIMPHKNNPDVFELIRARCNRLQALPNDITMITTNLPSGYHRDFQILKELIMPAFGELQQCLYMCIEALPKLIINTHILDDARYAYLYSVDAVNELVQQGMSFRDAYRQIALDIKAGSFTPPATITHTHEGSIGNLQLDLIRQQMMRVSAEVNTEMVRSAELGLVG